MTRWPEAISRCAMRLPMAPSPTKPTTGRSFMVMRSLGCHDRVVRLAEPGDLHPDPVAGLQESRRVHLGAYSRGCTRDEDVAGSQPEDRAHALDQPCNVDDHVAGVAVLAELVVDPHPDVELLRVGHLVGGE